MGILRRRNPIRIRIDKFERGDYDDDSVETELLPEHEAWITAPVRMAGRQALKTEFPLWPEGTNNLRRTGLSP